MVSLMTKTEALALLDCSIVQLAEKLGISHSAVSQWDEEQIPLAREYQIRDIANGKEPLKSKSTSEVTL